jgi:hypothetical protein
VHSRDGGLDLLLERREAVDDLLPVYALDEQVVDGLAEPTARQRIVDLQRNCSSIADNLTGDRQHYVACSTGLCTTCWCSTSQSPSLKNL